MSSLNFRLIFLLVLIVLLAVIPWMRLLVQAFQQKQLRKMVVKGAVVTFLILTTVLGLLFLGREVVGEYSVYLMMISLIFGSWIGYLLTKKQLQIILLGPLVAPREEVLDDIN